MHGILAGWGHSRNKQKEQSISELRPIKQNNGQSFDEMPDAFFSPSNKPQNSPTGQTQLVPKCFVNKISTTKSGTGISPRTSREIKQKKK